MRADLFVVSGVLIVGLMTACHGGLTSPDAGSPSDSGVFVDGGTPSDGGVPDAGPSPEAAGCDVAMQTGCPAGAVCLRGVLGDGGLGNVCFPGECDAVAQNCPAGNRCAYVQHDDVTQRRCVPAGTVAEGGACGSVGTDGGDFYDTCQAGLSCTDGAASGADGGASTFSCQRLCYSGAQCAAPRDCIDVLRFEGSNERPRVCGTPGTACDVLASQCKSPLGCYPSPQSGGVCVSAGTVADGQSCAYVNDCQSGSACIQGSSAQVCRRLCRSPSGTPACEGSLHCQALPNTSGVGACVP